MIFSSAVILFHLISSELKRSGLKGFEVHKTQKVGDIQQTPWKAGRVTGPLPGNVQTSLSIVNIRNIISIIANTQVPVTSSRRSFCAQ